MGSADRTPGVSEGRPLAMISFDVEQFDIPAEYGVEVPVDEQFEIGRRGLERVLGMLEGAGAPATFFVTAEFGLRFPDVIRGIVSRGRHEIASHGYTHGDLEPGHLAESRRVLEDIARTSVRGFRRARMADTDPAEIARAGYAYNASENPIWLPGRYNHFFSARRARVERTDAGDLVQIPASATPLIRLPLFWLAFKNLPMGVIRAASAWVLAADGALNTYFHPWEFAEIGRFALPGVVKRIDGERLLSRLGSYIAWLARRAELTTYSAYAAQVLAESRGSRA